MTQVIEEIIDDLPGLKLPKTPEEKIFTGSFNHHDVFHPLVKSSGLSNFRILSGKNYLHIFTKYLPKKINN